MITVMNKRVDDRKGIKISPESHSILKKYCDDNGLKMEWYLNKLIKENCKIEKDNK